jgi:hypothetical protein
VNGVTCLVQVDDKVFQDMFEKGVLIGNVKYLKDWATTTNGKHYVGDLSWIKYCEKLKVEQQS